ncbi:ribonucleases P/MRP protein subunit POP1 isoform X1 [Patella vulgata]|uniref:ribonucleases P/MRP protein subunit POP1 isoform X1 n=2 Tax=Patella vulgata TaxID=6465 RepID=UPI00217FC231|nr:ribonucleases P/MRP protein subunit POP1 isoform X1 [Patella vulgata]
MAANWSTSTNRKRSSEGHQHGFKKKTKPNNNTPWNKNLATSLPRELKACKFAESRAAEITALTKNVEHIGSCRVVFQKLPRHLRRRAMSHNIKRLPRRVQEPAKIEYEVRPQNGGKKPSRKHRRRPKNLLIDYYRRQRKIKWLETHIWHAKRFHMGEKWGYRLAVRPTDRSYRACYRASANHCLLQDVSYECCIEVIGGVDLIKTTFTHLMTVDTGTTIGGAAVINGNRMGYNVLYHYDQYPYKAIGKVCFLWKPNDNNNGVDRQLWIWCHPSYYQETWREITQAFKTDDLELENKMVDDCPFDQQVQVGNVQITSLKDNLIKFRLTGALSQTILIDALKPADVQSKEAVKYWWQTYYDNDINISQHKHQIAGWTDLMSCQSPAEVSPNMVLSLTVRDPRLSIPDIKTKVKPNLDGLTTTDTKNVVSSPVVAQSPLWDVSIRKDVKSTKLSEAELNKLRSNQAVPGTPLILGDAESRIPIILIQRPGQRDSSSHSISRHGFGSGWDIIVPSGWGMAFHIAFMYRGCRAGGLQEAESLAAEMGHFYMPLDFPETVAGQAEQAKISVALEEKYKRYPPDKKPNFVKLGTASPFSQPFESLNEAWRIKHEKIGGVDEAKNRELNVLRNKRVLRLIAKTIEQKSKMLTSKSIAQNLNACMKQLENLIKDSVNTLVPVQIKMDSRGLPLRCAGLYIPNLDDLSKIKQDRKYGGPKEKPHPDPNKNKSKDKKQRNSEFKASKVGLDENDRSVIGFMNSGRFIFGQGQGSGIAFCSLIGLYHLIKSIPQGDKLRVLVRNPSSLQYRFASVVILV